MNKFKIILILSIVALFNAVYLSNKAYQLNYLNPETVSSFCDLSKTSSCTEVLKHPLSKVFGIPFPWMAVVVYVALIALSYLGYKKKDLWYAKVIQKIAFAGMLFNGFIIYREIFYIYSYCLLCLACTAIIISIFVLSTLLIKENK